LYFLIVPAAIQIYIRIGLNIGSLTAIDTVIAHIRPICSVCLRIHSITYETQRHHYHQLFHSSVFLIPALQFEKPYLHGGFEFKQVLKPYDSVITLLVFLGFLY
jgi:hypothetical protein